MDLLKQDDLNQLIEATAVPKLTLYMPLQREPDKDQENIIHLKNVIKQAENLFEKHSEQVDDKTKEQLLQPVRRLLDSRIDPENGTGMAIFISPEMERIYKLPALFLEAAMLGNDFYVKPIVPLVTNNGRYYLLTLSQNDVRLYQGSRDRLDAVELDEFPTSLADTMWYEDPEKRTQLHTQSMSPAGGGSQTAFYHGHPPSDDKKNLLLRFFHELDENLRPYLADKEAPLILAGVDYLHPIYAEANSYENLVEAGIHGNPDEWNEKELRHKAWAQLEPYFEQGQKTAVSDFNNLSGTERIATGFDEVIPAAFYGRVDTLFVPEEGIAWGAFDEQANKLQRFDEEKPNSSDLFNLATIQTLKNSGTVHIMSVEHIPGEASIAATLRYAISS